MPALWKHPDGSVSRVAVPYDGTQNAATAVLQDGSVVPVLIFQSTVGDRGVFFLDDGVAIRSIDVASNSPWSYGADTGVVNGRRNYVGPRGPGGPPPPPPPPPPPDLSVFRGALAAYSTRNPAGSNYTGPLLRVRRSSDNLERDIPMTATADANGNRWLDIQTLTEFVGASDGYVTTWYNQIIGGTNATQATSHYQPMIVRAGVVGVLATGKPTVLISDMQNHFRAFTVTTQTGVSFNAVASPNTVFSDSNLLSQSRSIGESGIGGYLLRRSLRAIQYFTNLGASSTNVLNPGVPGVWTVRQSLAAAAMYFNGTQRGQAVGISGTINAPYPSVIGSMSEFSDSWDGSVAELTAYPYSISITDKQLLERSQGSAYNITVA